MKSPWFRTKRYGWGWYPVSWQGWVVTVIYGIVLAISVGRVSNYALEHSVEGTVALLIPVGLHVVWIAILVGSLMYICMKTDEKHVNPNPASDPIS